MICKAGKTQKSQGQLNTIALLSLPSGPDLLSSSAMYVGVGPRLTRRQETVTGGDGLWAVGSNPSRTYFRRHFSTT